MIGIGPAPNRSLLTRDRERRPAAPSGSRCPATSSPRSRATCSPMSAQPPDAARDHVGHARRDASRARRQLPRLGAGQAALVLARVKRAAASNARVRGDVFGFTAVTRAARARRRDHALGALARRWARSKLDDLVAAGNARAIAEHALRYGLVSPQTSMVAIGDDVIVAGRRQAQRRRCRSRCPRACSWQLVEPATHVDTTGSRARRGARREGKKRAEEARPRRDRRRRRGRARRQETRGDRATPRRGADEAPEPMTPEIAARRRRRRDRRWSADSRRTAQPPALARARRAASRSSTATPTALGRSSHATSARPARASSAARARCGSSAASTPRARCSRRRLAWHRAPPRARPRRWRAHHRQRRRPRRSTSRCACRCTPEPRGVPALRRRAALARRHDDGQNAVSARHRDDLSRVARVRHIRLVVEYDGSQLHGWQRQDNGADRAAAPRGGAREAAAARGAGHRRVAHRCRRARARAGRELSHRAADPAARHSPRAQLAAARRDRDPRRDRGRPRTSIRGSRRPASTTATRSSTRADRSPRWRDRAWHHPRAARTSRRCTRPRAR